MKNLLQVRIFIGVGIVFSPLSLQSVSATTIVWANNGSTWATGANWVNGTAPADSTTTDIASFGSGGPVNPSLSAQRSINGVAFQSGASAYTISGSILTIGASGILDSATSTETFGNGIRVSAAQTWTVGSGGSLIFSSTVDLNNSGATSRTLIVNGAGNATFNGAVQNTFAGSTGIFTYAGTGTVTFSASNSYSGGTNINSGAMLLQTGATLGGGSVSLGTGSTLTMSSGVTNAIADNATLSLGGSGGTAAKLILQAAFGTMQDTIGGLTLNNVAQPLGTYGSSSSNAQFKSDEYFTGTGMITVIPEPGTWAMIGAGLLTLLAAQRRWRVRRA